MKTTSFSQELLRDTLIFGGTLAILMVLWHFVGVPGVEAALIDPSDNPENISGATGGQGSLRTLARTVINWFLAFLGLIATIMVIYGGVMYVTSSGKEDQVEKGKKILLYAIVGIVIILLSFALVNTVISGAGTGDETVT